MIENNPEHQPITRDQVVAAFADLKKQGIEDPWDQNGKAKAAWDLYSDFFKTASKSSEESSDPKAPLELNQQISIDMIIIEAGFPADKDSLETILDFLEQDLEAAEEMKEEKYATELRHTIEIYTKKLKDITG